MVNLKLKFPEGFFEEEERCGFKVTKKRKEIWAVELDLLAELLRVCKKHDITIFASGGTMLGAVRHKGFIPWDDDVDMMMMRSEYEKLCAVAPDEFKEPYFFQTAYTDPGSFRGHAQLRNSLTTGILMRERTPRLHFNMGIFIDIFPLDAVPDDPVRKREQMEELVRLHHVWGQYIAYNCDVHDSNFLFLRNLYHSFKRRFIIKTENHLQDYMACFREYEKLCAKYNGSDSKLIGTISFAPRNSAWYKARKDFEELIDWDFEFLNIPIGKGWDHALTVRYGNWEDYVMGANCHGDVLFDTDKPYSYYLKGGRKK